MLRYKQVNKLGRFADDAPDPNEIGADAASALRVGDRCEVQTESGMQRGSVAFVGKMPQTGQTGWWAGVRLDLPLGRNNGSAGGKQFFSCPDKYGIFVRPDRVTAGDFPEIDDGLDDLEEL